MHGIMDFKSHEKFLINSQTPLRKFFIKIYMGLSLCIDKNILIYDNRLYFDSAMDKNKQMKVCEKG